MNNIGELNEKEIHHLTKMILSNWNIYLQEIKVGSYIADVKIGNYIKEVQTSNFKNLITKINYYLSNGYNVEIVYPLVNKSQIHYINRVTKGVDYKGKRHLYKTKYDALREIYWIKQFIDNDNFSIRIMLYEVTDYRYSDNKQKIKKTPTSLLEEIYIRNVNDFKQFIPKTLNKEFIAKEFRRETKTRSRYYHGYLRLLESLGVISSVGKKGNTIIWHINDNIE